MTERMVESPNTNPPAPCTPRRSNNCDVNRGKTAPTRFLKKDIAERADDAYNVYPSLRYENAAK